MSLQNERYIHRPFFLMIMLGLIGEYIGRIYISINNSPQYVIREETGGKESADEDQVE